MSDNLKEIELIALSLCGNLERISDTSFDKKTMTVCVTENSMERFKEELKKIVKLTKEIK